MISADFADFFSFRKRNNFSFCFRGYSSPKVPEWFRFCLPFFNLHQTSWHRSGFLTNPESGVKGINHTRKLPFIPFLFAIFYLHKSGTGLDPWWGRTETELPGLFTYMLSKIFNLARGVFSMKSGIWKYLWYLRRSDAQPGREVPGYQPWKTSFAHVLRFFNYIESFKSFESDPPGCG